MAIQFSKEQITNRLKLDNPWWETGIIEDDINKYQRRGYFDKFYKLVKEKEVRRAVVLMGPRRVGKTVMLYHTIDKLIKNGVPPKNICYCSIDVPLYSGISLEEIFNLYRELTNSEKNKEVYFFYDEVQYLKDWEIHLKSLVDAYRQSKFIVSGSAAAALRMKSNESGAGRFTDFMLPPLTFHEFLCIKNKTDDYDFDGDIKKLNEEFIDYINYGGYPEILNSEIIKQDFTRYIRHDIIDKVLLRDLPSLYGINDPVELNRFFTTLAYNSGNEFTMEGLSRDYGIAKNTIYKYLEYLEAAFLIRRVYRVGFDAKPFKRNTYFKVYLTNPSLRSALFGEIRSDDIKIGQLVETAIYSQLFHLPFKEDFHYARWQNGEVDIVQTNLQKSLICEIKWSNIYHDNPNKLKSLLSFCTNNNRTFCTVTTIDIRETLVIQGITIYFRPAAEETYTHGRIHKNLFLKNTH